MLAGRRRFWGTVFFFLIANTGVWIGYHRRQSHRIHGLEVVRFDPGDGATVEVRAQLTCCFNMDVPLPRDGALPPGLISPVVPGQWHWQDARTLAFAPDSVLPRATRFMLTIPVDRVATADGFGLARPFVASFQTSPLKLISVRQAGSSDEGGHVLEFSFNDVVLPADLQSHLTLTSSEGKPVHFTANGQAPAKTVRVNADALRTEVSGTFVTACVSAGLAGQSGPLGLAEANCQRVPITATLVALDASAYCPTREDPRVRLRFNNQINPEDIRQVLSIEPAVPFTLEQEFDEVVLHGAFRPTTRYAVRIAQAPQDGGRRFPQPAVLSVFIPQRSPAIWFEHEEGYLGSQGNRTVLARVVNVGDVRVNVTRVYDNNLIAWRNAANRRRWVDPEPYSRPTATRDIHVSGQRDAIQDVPLALDELLPSTGPRDGVYRLSVSRRDSGSSPRARGLEDDEEYVSAASTVVTLSDIGLCARQGREDMTVWATSLGTTRPVAGVSVRVFSDKNQPLGNAITGDDGIAHLVGLHPAAGENAAVIVAQQADGAGTTWLDLRPDGLASGEKDTAGRPYLRSGYEAFVYTDRGVYRPGETVHLRALVRGPEGVMPARFPVRWQIRRPDLHDWKGQMVELDADGAASLPMDLPGDLPTGRWTASIGLPGERGGLASTFGSAAFGVEEFVPDRMKVAVKLSQAKKGSAGTEERLTWGDQPLAAEVQADYLFGQPVVERPATLVARLDPATFQSPRWSGWTFGDSADVAGASGRAPQLGRRLELPDAELNCHGHARWDVNLDQVLEEGASTDSGPVSVKTEHRRGRHRPATPSPRATAPPAADFAGPWRLTVTAAVTEAGGRALTATSESQIDRAPYYLAIRPQAATQQPGEPCVFDIRMVTPKGDLAGHDGQVTVRLLRESWNTSLIAEDGHYRFQSTRVLSRASAPSDMPAEIRSGSGTCQVTPGEAGTYVLQVVDAETNSTTTFGFVAGADAWQDNISRQDPQKIELSVQPAPWADPGRWAQALRGMGLSLGAPGAFGLHARQPAQVIVRSPFAGRLLLTVETDEVVSTRVMAMPASHVTVPIDLPEACQNNVFVTATVLRAVDPRATWQPHRASGCMRVRMAEPARRLVVDLFAPKEARPQQTLSVPLRVTDFNGEPVAGAAVTVAAVDEGICQLTNFAAPDPLAFFTADRALGVRGADVFGQLMPEVERPDRQSAAGGDRGEDPPGPSRHSPVAARRVRPIALVSGTLHTDEHGVAQAEFQVPQFTGQLRLMAVASSGPSFGSVQRAAFVRSPVFVQSSWPRFCAPFDRFSVSLVIFNNTSQAGNAKIRMNWIDDAAHPSPLRFAEAAGDSLDLPPIAVAAGGQAIASFEVSALNRMGVAQAHLTMQLGGETYEEHIELPVRPATPAIALGGYAKATPATQASLDVPAGMMEGTERFELRVAGRPALELPQGLDYLDRYPYGCVEQTTSTLFPLVYLSDIGKQIAPQLFQRDQMETKIQAGITHLLAMQTASGGLAMWPGGAEPWPWASVYAAHFLVEAKGAAFHIPDEFLEQLLHYVRARIHESNDNPDTLETQAYACYVLALAGKPDRAAMSRLGERMAPAGGETARDLLGVQARFHLAAAWLAAGRRDLADGLIPASLPSPRAARQRGGNIGSPIRDRAVLISTLLAVQPDHPALPDLAQQLADAGRDGQWSSTQDVAFSVMALGRYLRQSKSARPVDTAELLLDGRQVAAESGGTLFWSSASEKTAIAGRKLNVRVGGPPDSAAYVAWLQTGVPLKAPQIADHGGLKVRREYLDARGKPIRESTVRSGDVVQVAITIEATGPIDNLVIDDLLPAGLEIENTRLEGQASDVVRTGEQPIVPAFEETRIETLDDRLILIGRMRTAGVGRYTYVARAVTPGSFAVPPVKAECMYDIGTNSLWGTGTLRVTAGEKNRVADAAQLWDRAQSVPLRR